MSIPSARSLHRSRETLSLPPSPPSFPKLLPLLRRVINCALRLVPIDALKPTEGADPVRVGQLRGQIEADGSLNEPLDTVEGSALVNGHTRESATRLLNCRHVLVLDHAITDLTCATWAVLNRHPVLQVDRRQQCMEMPLEDFLRVRGSLAFAACIMSLEDGLCRAFLKHEALGEALAQQNDVYQIFAQTANGQPVERFPDHELPPSLSQCWQKFGTQGEILLYPAFSPEQILEVAHMELKVAPGATRFGFPYRLTNLRVPLSLLRSGESTERKNQRLQAVLRAHPLSSFDGETFIPQPSLDAKAYEEV